MMSEESRDNKEVKEIIERAKSGDSEAFTFIYNTYLTPIYRFIYFRVKQKDEAEDLTQAVFVKAWQALGTYQDQGHSFSAWLYRIARNTIIDYWKKRKDIIVEDVSTVSFDHGTDDALEDEVYTGQMMDLVREHMHHLSEEQQTILTLKFINELTNTEIEEITGKTQEAIRALQYRALKALKEQLATRAI